MLMWFSINFDAQFPFLLMLSKYDAAQWLRGSVGLFSDSRTDRCHLWVNVPRVTTFPPLFIPLFFFRITDMKSFSSRLSVTFRDHFKGGSSTTFFWTYFLASNGQKYWHIFCLTGQKYFYLTWKKKLSDLPNPFFARANSKNANCVQSMQLQVSDWDLDKMTSTTTSTICYNLMQVFTTLGTQGCGFIRSEGSPASSLGET